MPFETVQEKVVQEKRVLVCSRCRQPIPHHQSQNRRAYHTVGSLGTSLGGSILAGAVLGPVGAIGGAIAGSIAGARASDKVCDAVESKRAQGTDLCEACRAIVAGNSATSAETGGGHRLGSGEPVKREVAAPGERIKEGAQVAGQKLGEGFNWMKNSVNSAIENVKQKEQKQNPNSHDSNQQKPPAY